MGEGIRPFFSDANDAYFAYCVFLGRPPESRQALLGKVGQPWAKFIGGFLLSVEFQEELVRPILHGKAVGGGRFPGRPEPQIGRWLCDRVVSTLEARAAVAAARDWTALYEGMLLDQRFKAILCEVLGAEAWGILGEGFLLRRGGMGERSASRLDGQLSCGPLFSFVVDFSSADLEAQSVAIESVLAQSSYNWELIIAETVKRASSRLWLDGLSALSCRIKVALLREPYDGADPFLPAYDLAGGDYLVMISSRLRMPMDLVERCARTAITSDRPDVLIAELESGPVHLFRTDQAARGELFKGETWLSPALAADAMLLAGARGVRVPPQETADPTEHST